MSLFSILIVVLLVAWICGAFPIYRTGFNYGHPYNIAGLVLLILVLYLIFGGRLHAL